MKARSTIPVDAGRRRDLAAIHVAKKKLHMDDETYRAMLWSVGRVSSSADLDYQQRKAVLAHLRARGFNAERATAQDPTSRKIRALWLRLKGLKALRDPAEEALERFVENQTGVKKLQWLSSAQAAQVIESLKAWEKRVRREAECPK